MKTVRTKEELAQALKAGETHIMVKGELAETMRKRKKRKKMALIGGGALLLAGIVAIPFTGGASAAAAATALTVSAGTFPLSMTAAEVAIICGTVVGGYGLVKNRKLKLKFAADGVEINVI